MTIVWDEAAEEQERADRIAEVKSDLARSLRRVPGVQAVNTTRLKNDLIVTGSLTAIHEWASEWRSEIEELGD